MQMLQDIWSDKNYVGDVQAGAMWHLDTNGGLKRSTAEMDSSHNLVVSTRLLMLPFLFPLFRDASKFHAPPSHSLLSSHHI